MSDERVEEGEVLEIGSSKVQGKTLYRLLVKDLDTGDEDWFGLGEQKPDYGEGSIISFDFQETDKGYLNIFDDSLDVIDEVKPKGRGGRGSSRGSSRSSRGSGRDESKGGRGSSRGNSSRGGSRGSRGGSDDDDSKSSSRGRGRNGGNKSGNKGGGGGSYQKDPSTQKLIELQAARNAASEFLKVALEQGAISLPAKKADKLDFLIEAHNECVARFLEQNETYVEAEFDINSIYEQED